jgi:hypothetical protein
VFRQLFQETGLKKVSTVFPGISTPRKNAVIGFEIRAVMLGVSSFFRVSHSKEEHYPWITVGISTGNLPQEC